LFSLQVSRYNNAQKVQQTLFITIFYTFIALACTESMPWNIEQSFKIQRYISDSPWSEVMVKIRRKKAIFFGWMSYLAHTVSFYKKNLWGLDILKKVANLGIFWFSPFCRISQQN
jgi:hypothetical protein